MRTTFDRPEATSSWEARRSLPTGSARIRALRAVEAADGAGRAGDAGHGSEEKEAAGIGVPDDDAA